MVRHFAAPEDPDCCQMAKRGGQRAAGNVLVGKLAHVGEKNPPKSACVCPQHSASREGSSEGWEVGGWLVRQDGGM